MATNLDLTSRASSSKKQIGRSIAVNGVHAVDVELKESANLTDPILNVNVKVNNPIGRFWLALKRIWKSQNTVIALRLTIPLIVLPIVIYAGWAIWQGRGVRVPMSKLGMVHQVKVAGTIKDILVLPTSDVYMLDYSSDFRESQMLREKPVVVVGTYRTLDNSLTVETAIPYSPTDILPSDSSLPVTRSMWDTLLRFIGQFK